MSIIVPVFNEAGTLLRVIRQLARLRIDKEILVVDDGSTDTSGDLLDRLRIESVRVIRHPRNMGKGAAVRTGLAAARGRFTVIQDADLETDPGDIPAIMRPLTRVPRVAVFGTRFPANSARIPRSRLTWLANKLLTGTTNFLFGAALTDVACAYKAAPTRLLKSLNLRSNRFEMEAEIAARLLARGVQIVEVPVRYRPRTYAEGKKIHPVDGLRILMTLLRLKMSLRPEPPRHSLHSTGNTIKYIIEVLFPWTRAG